MARPALARNGRNLAPALVAFGAGLAVINATGVYAQLVAARSASAAAIETEDAALATKLESQIQFISSRTLGGHGPVRTACATRPGPHRMCDTARSAPHVAIAGAGRSAAESWSLLEEPVDAFATKA